MAIASQAWASGNNAEGYFAIDAGMFGTNLAQRFGAPAGYGSEVSSLTGFLRFRKGFSLGKRFYFEPSLALALPWRTNVDGSTMIFPIQFDLDVSVPIFSFLAIRLGPGIYSQLVYGSGGVVQLNNGDSFANFAAPSGLSMSFTFTTEIGLEILLFHHVSLNFDAYVLAIASQARRTYQGAISLGVKL